MLWNKTSIFLLNRTILKKICILWDRHYCKLHVSSTVQENAETKLSPEERLRMKQKRKEAKRQERIEIQRQKQLKKNIENQLPFQEELNGSFPETYNPRYVESKWYNHWMEHGVFDVDSPCYLSKNEKGKFTMCLPPPNVTGNLHLGHALGCSIQDSICRWHRMKGERVTWVPGCDHAGIATQVVVEKKLKKELGLSRHDLGKDKFLEEVWKWKEQYGDEIMEQIQRLGCSLDWSRMTFTLDPKLNNAVNEAFIRLFDEGLIQRNRRLVNWSSALKSAISDIEVDNITLSGPTKIKVPGYKNEIQFGIMHTFSYPISGSDGKLMVSTTRLETMLGDVGVAVNPSDSRYSQLIGRHVIHPFTNEALPIVADCDVSPDFGTGAVKLTPGHDATDLKIATRHNLNIVNILDESGYLINVPHEFINLPRFDAREMVMKKLDSLGLMAGVTSHSMSLPICSRSGDVVEYIIKDQWFVDCRMMTIQAREAVESGRLEFIPGHYAKQWKTWLDKTSEWCISRQLWWGHRIPAYKISTSDISISEKEIWVAAHDANEAKLKASKMLGRQPAEIEVVQDEDVLDTWFSSALIPFSVFGWPNKTSDIARFYPTDLIETASDIMFFWVARMVMMGEKLTGQLPFKKVHFHSVIQDSKGRKMSKSLGNVIDPMHVIEGVTLEELHASLNVSNLSMEEIKKAKPIVARDFPTGIPDCGADALRFALCSYSYHNHFINVDVHYMKFCKTFCNKIWQSFRFVSGRVKQADGKFVPIDMEEAAPLSSAMDIWILSRLSGVISRTNEAFNSFKLFEATKALQIFWWSEFCNTYLECIKPTFEEASPDEDHLRNSILIFCFTNFLQLLHPFMPFLTEHLFHELKKISTIGIDLDLLSTISLAEYPTHEKFKRFTNKEVENEMKYVLDISTRINSFKNLLKLSKSTQIPVYLSVSNNFLDVSIHLSALKTLTRSSSIILLSFEEQIPSGCMHLDQLDGCDIYLQLKESVDIGMQMEELVKLRSKYEKEEASFERHVALKDRDHEEHLMIAEKLTGVKTILDRINRTILSLKNI